MEWNFVEETHVDVVLPNGLIGDSDGIDKKEPLQTTLERQSH